MSSLTHVHPPGHGTRDQTRQAPWWSPRPVPWGVLVAALAGAAAWAPYVTKPLSSDEGGFLMVAAQWSPGTSLYGDYWVDRPPLLIQLFDLAGGAVGLRLMGMLAVVVTVLLAGRVGHQLAPWSRSVPVWCAATAAVFLSTPLFGIGEVDGEVLAVPFVMAGLAAALQAYADPVGRNSRTWWLLAGASGACAALVKQNLLDVFVAVAVLTVLMVRAGASRAVVRRSAYSLVGAGVVTALAVGWAAARGTDPVELWDAMVTFRFQAAAVIHASSTATTPGRAIGMTLAALLSGAIPIVVLLGSTFLLRRRFTRAHALAVALLAWEVVGVVGGGSYWLHYLIGAVPGLVVAVAATLTHSRLHRFATRAIVALAAVSAVVSLGQVVHAHPSWREDVGVESYLRAHAHPGDTGVMAFGHPDVLRAAGLASPYEELWSLPVRVRDPQLTELTRVLEGPARPTWVVVSGSTLATWGVDDRTAQAALVRLYHPVTALDGYTVYLLDGVRGQR